MNGLIPVLKDKIDLTRHWSVFDNNIISDELIDHENGILLLNLLADVWDLLEQYNLLYKESEMEKESTHLKPTCTVMIKYMKDMNDIYFAHNAWHMYQAMSYRILKNYKFNYHVLPGSSVLIPGHTIAMSSYAGTVIR